MDDEGREVRKSQWESRDGGSRADAEAEQGGGGSFGMFFKQSEYWVAMLMLIELATYPPRIRIHLRASHARIARST